MSILFPSAILPCSPSWPYHTHLPLCLQISIENSFTSRCTLTIFSSFFLRIHKWEIDIYYLYSYTHLLPLILLTFEFFLLALPLFGIEVLKFGRCFWITNPGVPFSYFKLHLLRGNHFQTPSHTTSITKCEVLLLIHLGIHSFTHPFNRYWLRNYTKILSVTSTSQTT